MHFVQCLVVTLFTVSLTIFAETLYTTDPTHQKYMWESFKSKYSKQYESVEEDVYRFEIFIENLKIADHRTENEKLNGGSAIHGITKFSDLSQEEFKKRYLNLILPEKFDETKFIYLENKVNATAELVDWSANGKTTAVKDQGYCGGCWAFSATEQIESDSMIQLGTSFVLSPQQLIDCDVNTYNKGCNGGYPAYAYYYVYLIGGQEKDSDYPYSSYYTGTSSLCKAVQSKFKITVTDYKQIKGPDAATIESSMATYVQTNGPLSTGVDSSQWNSYTKGIVTTCGTFVDHAIQVVGIDTSKGYWKIRNSWGTSWGESGYIRLKYGNNTCGLTSYPTYTKTKTV